MEYIIEYRGGFDEWSDEYKAVLGVRLADGTEISRFPNDIFTDQNGNELEVEFPARRHSDRDIKIERYAESYKHWGVSSLSKLEDATDEENRVINTNEL